MLSLKKIKTTKKAPNSRETIFGNLYIIMTK